LNGLAQTETSAQHLEYGDIEFAYKPQKADAGMGGEIKFRWNTRTTKTR